MLVPDRFRKCVAFICYRIQGGEIRLAGTAFLMSVDAPEINAAFGYFVTARHVIAEITLRSLDQIVLLRLNTQNGNYEYIETYLHDWRFHPDDSSADIATIALSPDTNRFDVLIVDQSVAVNEDRITKEEIGVGDEIVITGLFVSHYGTHRNLPIIRVGNIAMMPEEPVVTRKFGAMDAYLIEARSIGGLSGSPVFVHKSNIRARDGRLEVRREGDIFLLLGLIHGHWDIAPMDPESDTVIEDIPQSERINMGVGIVVPASKILETINQDYYQMVRGDLIMKKLQSRGGSDSLPE